jgi:predicted AlkP superfamily pyrophosphatase or phosphodiesterase
MDGVRPDAVQAARTPNLDRLVREGTVSWTARTTLPSSTLPCHTSMLRGVDSTRHGITSNHFQPLVRPVPSLFDVAKDQGRRTGFFYNWEQLRDLAAPGKLDASFMWGDYHSAEGDRRIAEIASDTMRRIDFDFAFVYFGWPDECAHRTGWMSQPYFDAITNADEALGQVLRTREELGWADDTVTLVVSDHGGHERTHGTDMEEDVLIPWILHGPGVRSGVELDPLEAPVRIYDTCVTLAHALGLTPAGEWEGAVIRSALA